MNAALWTAFEEHKVGSALHLPFLYSAVIGLEAKHVFEVGAGVSTHAILCALKKTGGRLTSCSTDDPVTVAGQGKFDVFWGHGEPGDAAGWTHLQGQSQEKIPEYLAAANYPWFDLVFHDGSHSGAVIQSDLGWLLPRVKRYGLVLVHDVLHSYSGREVRKGLWNALQKRPGGAKYSVVALPYGFGLAIIRVDAAAPGTPEITLKRSKVGSKHVTEQFSGQLTR
jgi:predicted O-methyltransferase YrrM